MKLNDSKISLTQLINKQLGKQMKKFNSKGYFYQVDPFDDKYLKIKHQAYQKNRHTEDKENFVYNLQPERMRVGFYQMKGCHVDEHNSVIKKRRVLKTINYTNEDSRLLQQSKAKSQNNEKLPSSCLLKKYIKRKQHLKTKSERALVSIFAQVRSNPLSIQSNSRQISHHSFKTSERDSRILSIQNKNKRQPRQKRINYLKDSDTQKQNVAIIAAYRDKMRSRKNKMKTIE